MVERVRNAKLRMENPLIARQILSVLPAMSFLYNLTRESINQKSVIVKEKIMKLSIDLQNLALGQDLFTKKETSLARIKRKHMKSAVKEFASKDGESY